jgi:hypothetical protein
VSKMRKMSGLVSGSGSEVESYARARGRKDLDRIETVILASALVFGVFAAFSAMAFRNEQHAFMADAVVAAALVLRPVFVHFRNIARGRRESSACALPACLPSEPAARAALVPMGNGFKEWAGRSIVPEDHARLKSSEAFLHYHEFSLNRGFYPAVRIHFGHLLAAHLRKSSIGGFASNGATIYIGVRLECAGKTLPA